MPTMLHFRPTYNHKFDFFEDPVQIGVVSFSQTFDTIDEIRLLLPLQELETFLAFLRVFLVFRHCIVVAQHGTYSKDMKTV